MRCWFKATKSAVKADGWVNKQLDFDTKKCCSFPVSYQQSMSFNHEQDIFLTKSFLPKPKPYVSDQKMFSPAVICNNFERY